MARGGKPGAAVGGQTGRTLPVPVGPCHPVPNEKSRHPPEITRKGGGDQAEPRSGVGELGSGR